MGSGDSGLSFHGLWRAARGECGDMAWANERERCCICGEAAVWLSNVTCKKRAESRCRRARRAKPCDGTESKQYGEGGRSRRLCKAPRWDCQVA